MTRRKAYMTADSRGWVAAYRDGDHWLFEYAPPGGKPATLRMPMAWLDDDGMRARCRDILGDMPAARIAEGVDGGTTR